jgi:hypothetical protein
MKELKSFCLAKSNNILIWLFSYLSVSFMDDFQVKLKSCQLPAAVNRQNVTVKEVFMAFELLKTIAGKHFGQEDPILNIIVEYRESVKSVLWSLFDPNGNSGSTRNNHSSAAAKLEKALMEI